VFEGGREATYLEGKVGKLCSKLEKTPGQALIREEGM